MTKLDDFNSLAFEGIKNEAGRNSSINKEQGK